MTPLESPSPDFRGTPQPGAVFMEALQRETRRHLPATLKFAGHFHLGGISVPRCTIQSEENVRFLAINIPAADLGQIARGTRQSRWTDTQIGRGLLTDILEAPKRRPLGAFKIFAAEQSFVVGVVTHRPDGAHIEFGRITEQSYLRLFVPLEHHEGPYRERAHEHFMDRLSKLFQIVEEQGLQKGTAWAQFLAQPPETSELAEHSFQSRIPVPEKLSSTEFQRMLSERLGIETFGIQFPSHFGLCDDQGHTVRLRIPIADSFLSYSLQREAETKLPARLALDGLRCSVEDEIVRRGVGDRIRVHLRNLNELIREDQDAPTLAAFVSGLSERIWRYVLSFEIELPGKLHSPELAQERAIVFGQLFPTLAQFQDYLGR